jgi:hypothetical protein
MSHIKTLRSKKRKSKPMLPVMDNLRMPSDPEAQNDSRSDWAEVAIRAFMQATGSDAGDAVSDLLADLAHYCDRHGLELGHELCRACSHYEEETTNEEVGESEGRQFTRVHISPREDQL